jgi:DNA invertase Pin-like site-specific DNA recombinase
MQSRDARRNCWHPASGSHLGPFATTRGEKLVFHIFRVFAEFEQEIIRERTQAGLSAARARGKSGGRPKALTEKQAQMLNNLRDVELGFYSVSRNE